MSNVPASGRFLLNSFSERSAMAVRLPLPRKKAPSPTDQHVGRRVRMRRIMLAMSQEKLGRARLNKEVVPEFLAAQKLDPFIAIRVRVLSVRARNARYAHNKGLQQ